MKPNFYEVSDSLAALKGLFTMHETVTLSEEGVRLIAKELERLRGLAREMENEVSCQRWNAMGAADLTANVLKAIEAPGTNVALFPVVPRPAFSDGGPSGQPIGPSGGGRAA